jgi:hypothetical protein
MVKTLGDKSLIEKREAGEHARPVVNAGPKGKLAPVASVLAWADQADSVCST